MPDSSSHAKVSRRKALVGIGATGLTLSQIADHAQAADHWNQDDAVQPDVEVLRCPNVASLRARTDVREGSFIETLGGYLEQRFGHSHGRCQ